MVRKHRSIDHRLRFPSCSPSNCSLALLDAVGSAHHAHFNLIVLRKHRDSVFQMRRSSKGRGIVSLLCRISTHRVVEPSREVLTQSEPAKDEKRSNGPFHARIVVLKEFRNELCARGLSRLSANPRLEAIHSPVFDPGEGNDTRGIETTGIR